MKALKFVLFINLVVWWTCVLNVSTITLGLINNADLINRTMKPELHLSYDYLTKV